MHTNKPEFLERSLHVYFVIEDVTLFSCVTCSPFFCTLKLDHFTLYEELFSFASKRTFVCVLILNSAFASLCSIRFIFATSGCYAIKVMLNLTQKKTMLIFDDAENSALFTTTKLSDLWKKCKFWKISFFSFLLGFFFHFYREDHRKDHMQNFQEILSYSMNLFII